MTRAEYERIVAALRAAGLNVEESAQPYEGGTLHTASHRATPADDAGAIELLRLARRAKATFYSMPWGGIDIFVQHASRAPFSAAEVAP